ncbi:hypothetical protein ACHAWT_005727 [Skeletonema menzelii]
MEDLSDDVSALSMDGASTIGKNFAFKRLQTKISDVQRLGTIQDAAENDIDAIAAAAATSGEYIIEPLPKTFEEWKEKKEKKKKKQKYKSSKRSHKKSRKKDREREDTSSANKLPPIPIKEIAIMSSSGNFATAAGGASSGCDNVTTPLSIERSNMSRSNASLSRKSRPTNAPGSSSGVYSHSHISVTSSTDSSTDNFSSSRRSSSILSGPGSSGIVTGRQSTTTTTRRSRPQHHPSEWNASQISSNSCTSHQSHVTIEKINQIKQDLERARLDEKQVLQIYYQLETEVNTLEMKSHRFQQQRQQIQQELESASSERYQLQFTLAQLQAENDKLRAKVRKAEEKEDRKRLDDVLDSMESKMRALKLQSKRSREKRRSSLEGEPS